MVSRSPPRETLDRYLESADRALVGSANGTIRHGVHDTGSPAAAHDRAEKGPAVLHVGVDLGTAYTVLFALDRTGRPLAGAWEFAEVIRDGVVVDFHGAAELVARLKEQVETALGRPIAQAATCYPPGVSQGEVRAARYVLEQAGIFCSALVDEPTAANAVLGIENGAVVDIGGGTTGIAIVRDGEVVYTADEPTGGTHLSLVIAGAKNISFEQAETLKTDSAHQQSLFPLVRPVIEKMGSIVSAHIAGWNVETVYLVGGTCAFAGMDRVIEAVVGVPTVLPARPLFVTPLGVAMNDPGIKQENME